MSLLFGNDRDTLRNAWHEAWQRRQAGLPLVPLQAQMADLIGIHPEYHAQLGAAPAAAEAADGTGAGTNPYLHLALHLALREQLATDRPAGIAAIHQRLARRGTAHEAEHRMLEVLAGILWAAQGAARAPDEREYLEALARL